MTSSNLKTAAMADRLASLGSDVWAVHYEARRRIRAGEDIIELAIGEPDIAVPEALIDVAEQAMRAGRTRYSAGRGEADLVEAIAQKYSKRSGRDISAANVLCVPGTQAALTMAMMTLVQAGDDVLVPDPYYATYEGVVASTGARFVPVPMNADNGFHLTADQLKKAITQHSKVLLLNSPHNPTGAVLNTEELAAIGEVCAKHNLWVICDEVYEQLIYEGEFASLFDAPQFADRAIAVSSISKSHAAPGFRSGWCVGPAWFTDKMQGVSEAILFGGQPFIADMTAYALTHEDNTAQRMAEAYIRRIGVIETTLAPCELLSGMKPASGMFMLVDVSATGLNGNQFATRLLDEANVAVMPGEAFGAQAKDFIRLSLTVDDSLLAEAASRLVRLAETIAS